MHSTLSWHLSSAPPHRLEAEDDGEEPVLLRASYYHSLSELSERPCVQHVCPAARPRGTCASLA